MNQFYVIDIYFDETKAQSIFVLNDFCIITNTYILFVISLLF